MQNLPYNKYSKDSIESYAKKLIGKTFAQILKENPILDVIDKDIKYLYYSNPKSKGSLGNLIEEHYFFYKPNNKPIADFPEAGVELKVTPYLIGKDNNIRAKERLVLNLIDYEKDYQYSFEDSHMYQKCASMLLVYYLHEPGKPRVDYTISYVKLFEFPEADLEIIKNDYYTIINKIKAGKADEISETDTIYLAACRKGRSNEDDVCTQPFSNKTALSRAFSLKQSYMTYILNNYIIGNNSNYEPIIKDISVLKNISLENYIIDKLSNYYGYSINELISKFNIKASSTNKGFNYILAKEMLNVLNDKIEEFEKANIQIKTIRLLKNGKIKENMSFPTFRYLDIINEDWESSNINNTFSNTKFLFMIYQYDDNNNLIFKKAMFWSVPSSDLNDEIKRVWLETVKRIKNGQYENLPKSSESPIFHVRPHGPGGKKDKYPTPDGGMAKRQCFWFHKKYIQKQIEEN